MTENKIQLAKVQMEEFKVLQDFEQIATSSQWNLHFDVETKDETVVNEEQKSSFSNERC